MKNNKILLYSVAVFLISFLAYIFTLSPGLTFTDSGELAASCITLGIAHPTGYPLFTLLGHLWTYLPVPGSEIYSLNLFASFLTALSSLVFFNTILLILQYISSLKIKANRIPVKNSSKKTDSIQTEFESENKLKPIDKTVLLISFASALIFTFARTVWSQAVSLEVYSLHLLMMNLILYFYLKASFSTEDYRKYYVITALFLGLSFSNHMTTVLLIPMILFLFFKKPSENSNFTQEKFKFLLLLTIPFIIGLSLYIYLPLRSATMPEFNWGWVSRNFEKFWYHFSGKQYQVWMFSGADVMKVNFVKFFEAVPYQLAWIGIIPFLYGSYVLFAKSKTLFTGIIILIMTCITYAINYSIHDIESYFVTAFTGIIIITSIGLWKISQFNNKLSYSFFLLPLIALIINNKACDQSDDNLVPEYTKLLFQKLEPDAVILSSQWDFWVSAAWYMQRIEGFRPDVMIIDKELLRRTWYLKQLQMWYPERLKSCQNAINDYLIDLELFESGKEYSDASIQSKFNNLLNCFIDQNYDKCPIYLTLDVIETERDAGADYHKSATGFAFKLTKDKIPLKVTVKDMDIREFSKSLMNNEGYLVDGIKTATAINFVNMGRYALMNGDREEAKQAFSLGYKIDPHNNFVMDAINNFNKFRFE